MPSVVPEQRETRPRDVPQVIAAQSVDPHFCNIEETIDEFERRIKAEEARYARLVASRQLYEYYMEPSDFKELMRESAFRLVNFDPNFDLPSEACPLPCPWEQPQPMQLRHALDGRESEFALPRPPKRCY